MILDVGNGLGTQDRLIAETSRPRRLVAVNITEWQLTAGRDRLRDAAAAPVARRRRPAADRRQPVDGIISVEAAFHFRSRKAFFAECYRVLRPGGVLSISDISAQRWPVTPAELLAGLTQLRVFGLRRTMAMTAGQIAAEAHAAGLAEVQVRRCGDRVIAPRTAAHGGAAGEHHSRGRAAHVPTGSSGAAPRRAWRCGRGSCWPARRVAATSRSRRGWVPAARRSASGGRGSCGSGWTG